MWIADNYPALDLLMYMCVNILCTLFNYRSFELGPGENGTAHVSSTVTYPTGTELGRDDSELTIQNPYVMMPSPRAQKGIVEKTFVFHSPQKLSDSPEENRVFDNPLYDETGLESRYRPPSTQAAPKKSSTLERAAEAVKEKISSMKRRTASTENLLDVESSGDSADYEDIVVGAPSSTRGGADYEEVVPRAQRRNYRPPPVPPKPSRKDSRLGRVLKEKLQEI